jgi:Bacterial protein of unknown function (DUF924)
LFRTTGLLSSERWASCSLPYPYPLYYEHIDSRARYLDAITEAVRYAHEHREAIERFGRYPTRNAALGRQNTPKEARILGLAAT